MQLDKFDFVRDLCNTKMDESITFIEKLLVKLKWPDPNGEAKILLLLLDSISIQYLWFKQDYPLDELEKFCSINIVNYENSLIIILFVVTSHLLTVQTATQVVTKADEKMQGKNEQRYHDHENSQTQMDS